MKVIIVTIEEFDTPRGCNDCELNAAGDCCGVSEEITHLLICGGDTALRIKNIEG